MSAQTAKKKRISSRRRVVNQNKTSEADDFHITDSSAVAQSHIPEGNTESQNVSADPENSQSETHRPTSPELTGNRRKLGSSRRSKGGQNVKESVTELYHEAREEVEENIRGNETPETTRISLTIQPESQEGLSPGSKHKIISATPNSSLYLATTPDFSSEVQSFAKTNCQEADLKMTKTENVQADHNDKYKVMSDSCKLEEPMQGRIDKSDTLQSEEVKENAHLAGISEISSVSVLSYPTVDQQLIDQSNSSEMPDKKLPNMYSGTEKGRKEKDDDTEFLRYDGNLQGSYVVSESHVESAVIQFYTTTEATTDKSSPREDTEAYFSSPKGELPTDEEQKEIFDLYEVRGAQPLEDSVDKVHEQEVKQTQMPNNYYSFESVINDATEQNLIEDDIKPSAEQTGHQEMEGLFSKMEESESSLQTLQSEIHTPLDSQLQQTDTGFNPIGNRRKMGSSRKNKVRQNAKGSFVESYHKPTEPLETTEMSLTIETAMQETSMETMLEEINTFDTAQTEEVSDQVKANAHVGKHFGITELNSSILNPCLTVDQQLINQSNFREMPEKLPNLYSVTEEDEKERDEDTELLRHDVNLWDNYLMSESPLKSEDTESYITLEESSNQHSLREHTEPKCSVLEADFSSPKQELPTEEVSDIHQSHQSEDAVNKVHKQEVEPTDMQEMPQIDYSFESVIHDATEHSEIISGNLIDQDEVSDTYQSELAVKNTEDSATKREDSNPDEKHDHPTKQNNFEASDQRNEEYHVYNTKKPQTSDIERVDSALGQVYETECRVEDDRKSSAEQTGHQEREEALYEVEEHESSLPTLQSEIYAPLDSQPQQNDTGFNPFGNRRKLGSSRSNKGQHHVKDSVIESYHDHKEEVVESINGNEVLETKQMLLAIEQMSQEELSQGSEHDIIMPATHDSSLHSAIMPGYSSEVQNPTTINYPKAHLESESENLQEDHDERGTDFKVEVSGKTVGATLDGMDKSDTLQSQEVRGAHQSEDAANKVHKQEVEPTDMQEMPQNDYSFESVIHDATEHSEIISGNLIDQDEVSDTYQSELAVKNTEDSATKREDSNPDEKHEDHPTKQNNFEALHHRNEDYHVYDTKKPQISDIERVDSALGQVYETEGQVEDDRKPSAEQTGHQEREGLFSKMEESESSLQTLQSEIHTPLDSQLQQTNTGFNPIGNRRKMGSSRKNKVRQNAKGSVVESYHKPTEQVVGNTMDNEPLETTEMSLTIETAMQETSMETMLEEINTLDTAQAEEVSDQVKENAHVHTLDGELTTSSSMVDQQLIKQSNSTEMPKGEFPNVYSVTEKENKERDKDSELLWPNENIRDNYLVSESHLKSEDKEYLITPEITTEKRNHEEHTELECSVEQADFSSSKEELAPNEEQKEHVNLSHVRGARHSEDAVNKVPEKEVKPTPTQERPQMDYSSVKESTFSLQTLQSEIDAPLDSQPQHTDTGFNPIGNRRKLGSSRKNKGRQHAKDSVAESYHRPTEQVVGNTMDNEPLETTEMSLTIETAVQETSMETMLEEINTFDTAQTEEISDQVKENASPTVDQQMINQSNFREMPEELPNLYSVTEEEEKERDEDTELLTQEVHLWDHYLISESPLKSEDIKSSITLEISSDKHSPREHIEPKCNVEQADYPSPKQELPADAKQNEIFNFSEVRSVHQSEDDVNKVHKQEVEPTDMQEMPQIDYSFESVIHDATEHSKIISGNLIDQDEVSDTYQSELAVKNTEDSATKREDSNPDEKHDDHPTKQNNFEALHHRNEDYHVYDTKKPQISDIERVDSALGQVYETEGHVENDIKPSAEQTGHQEMEGLFSKMEESESSLQILQSEIHSPLDSQLQQTDTGFKPIGNRRKLGSSRKNKVRQNAKGSVVESYHRPTEQVVGNTMDNEPLETTEMSLTIETAVQETSMETMLEEINTFDTAQTEEISDQVKENASPTVDQQMINQSNFRETPEELPNLYSVTEEDEKERDEDTELMRHDVNLWDNYLMSESLLKSEETESYITLEISSDQHSLREHTEPKSSVLEADFSSPKQELPADAEQNEIFNFSEVRSVHQSEDAVNKVHKQEVEPTDMQEMPQIDYSFESVIHDATEHSEIISGNLIDQDEVSDTYQSELAVKNTEDSATKREDSNPDEKHEDHPTKQNNFEALHHRNEDYHVYDTKKPQISDIERVDSALGQVYETEGQVEDDIKPSAEQTGHQEREGLFSKMEESESSLQTLQSEIHTPLDSQLQQTNTGFNPIGNRRKLGSSRKNKVRQNAKGSVVESYHKPTEHVVGNTMDNEPLETTEMSLTIETAVEEISMETMLEEINTFDTAQTEEVSDQVEENAHVHTLDGELTTSSSMVDQQLIKQSNSTEMPKGEFSNVYSVTEKENKERDKDTELLWPNENIRDNYLVSESHLNSEDKEYLITPEITTEKSNHGEQTELECSVEQADFSSSKEELAPNEEQKEHVNLSHVRGARHSEDAVNKVPEKEVKPTPTQERPQMDYSSVKESKFSLQTLQSEMNAPLDSQPLDCSQGIKEETHTGFKPTGNRRKLGSSRRNKGRQLVTETYSELEDLETTKMSLGMAMKLEEFKDQIDIDLKPAMEIRKIRSTVNVKETTPEEDTVLSQNLMDNSTIETTDSTSSSGKDDFFKSNKEINEEKNNLIKDPTNHLTRNDKVKMDLIQWKDDSDIQNISYHDDNVTARSVTLVVLDQEEAFQDQNREALSFDKDSLRQEMNMQQTNYAIETVEDVAIKDYNTKGESLINVQVSGQDEVGENVEDPTKKDREAHEMNASQEIMHAAHSKTDTITFDTGVKGNFKAEPAAGMSEESRISTVVGASNTQQGIQDKTDLDYSENLLGKSKQKRKKMGSTRRTHLSRKPEGGMDNKDETRESDFNIEADMRNLDKMEEVEELPMIVTAEVLQNENAKPSLSPVYKEQQETKETSTVNDKGQKLQSSASDLQSIQTNMIFDIDDLKALLPEQSASHNEESVNPVEFVQVAEVRDSERNVTSHLDQKLDSNTEDTTNSGITGGSFVSSCETTLSTQNDEERPESVNVIQDQALKSAEAPVVAVADLEIVQSVVRGGAGEVYKNVQACIQQPSNVNEGAYDKNFEMKNSSPILNSANRRRKMGSTRRNLGSRTEGGNLHQKQLVDNEATDTTTNIGGVKTESFSGIKEKELQLQIEHNDSDSEHRKGKVFETVEYSHTAESQLKPPAHQTFEENHGQLVETEHQLPPSYPSAIPSTSPKHDVMSESGRRRRKMGSHRKSHGHQNNENQTAGGDRITDTQNGRDVESITDESVVKTTEEESLGLDKISEVDEIDKKALPSIRTSKAGEHSRPVSKKTPERVTPVQNPYTEIRLAQESQKTFSLAGNSRGADLRSKSFNVMMVGDSSVGKTSFMKRAQSGKFSLDLPASVGLDSCMWTVVVDGKPVVLQLWDTAGQERFHSITRQIFHKAQAFLLMYDITSSQSFSAISYWADCIQEGAAENVTILLIGNKSDHAERQVKTQQGEILAKEYNFEFMECSAATGENVIQSLETVARMLSQKVDTREEAMVLHKEPQQKKSSGCC